MPNKIRVLLADDTLIAREGWRRILDTADDIEVVGEAVTAPEVPTLVDELKPHVVLMDMRWFEDNNAGADAMQQALRLYPKTKFVAVTVDPSLVAHAKSIGAAAALLKNFTREELVRTIRSVHVLDYSDAPPQHVLTPLGAPEEPKVEYRSPAYLAAAILLPTLSILMVAAVFIVGGIYLPPERFVIAVFAIFLLIFVTIVFAGRFSDVIGEQPLYQLFSRVLDVFSSKIPGFRAKKSKEATDDKEG
ncbi:MAG TPA: response regulator transcription factor [Chloroflexia bacterium]|jgi:CheY-like chemotaxis protein